MGAPRHPGGTRVKARREIGEQIGVARQPAQAPPRADAAPMVALLDRVVGEGLPAFQHAVDAVDAAAVEEAGQELAALWSALSGTISTAMVPDAAEPQELTLVREAILRGVTLQTFRGAPLLQINRPIDTVGDVGRFIALQTEQATATVRDANALVAVLRADPEPVHAPNDDDEKKILGLLTAHPNPWQLAYLRAVVRAEGVEAALDHLSIDGRRDLDTVLAASDVILKRETVTAASSIGMLEPVLGEQKVRVMHPAPLAQITTELYGDIRLLDSVMVPYNRLTLHGLPGDGLVPAGTELVLETRLLTDRYRPLFRALELSRPHMGRPYIHATPEGTAVVGSKMKYTLRWPQPEPEQDVAAGVLVVPLTDVIEWASIGWTAEFDANAARPAKADETSHQAQYASMDKLGKEGVSVDQKWPLIGNHVVKATLYPQPDTPSMRDLIGGESLEVTFTQTVLELSEKTEVDWMVIEDETKPQPPTDAQMEQWAKDQNMTVEQLRNSPMILGRVAGYTPNQLLEQLKQQLDNMPRDAKDRAHLQEQVDSLAKAMERTSDTELRPIEALYVSGEDHTSSTRLLLYVAPDNEAPRSHHYPLRMWDFTLAGQTREYTDDGAAVNAWDNLRNLLKTYGNDAPYPDGNVRIRIDNETLPEDYRGAGIGPEIINLTTQGGSWSERWAGRLILAGATIAAFASGQPELILVITVYGAAQGFIDIAQRLADGDFEFDLRTGLDLLAIAGAVTAGITPLVTSVRGMGEVVMLGKTIGRLQIGVMVGSHAENVIEAARTGNMDKVYNALIAAAFDAAVVGVTFGASKLAHAGEAGPGEEPGPGAAPVPGEPAPGEEPGGAGVGPSTAAGVGGKTPTRPPGQTEPTEPRTGSAQAIHEGWASDLAQTGLAPREVPQTPAGPEITQPGTYTTTDGVAEFSTPEAAFRAYDEAVARAGGREVGVYRSLAKGPSRYVVRVGTAQSVSGPGENWESALHRHPNPDNIMTRRLPAPQDVQNTLRVAFRTNRPTTEFIDYPLPDGRRALVAYTVEPVKGEVTISYQRPNGQQVTRTFRNMEAYASHYAERTTYVEHGSPEWKWMMQDLHDFYADREPSWDSTAAGTVKGTGAGGAGTPEPGTAPVKEPVEEAIPPRAGWGPRAGGKKPPGRQLGGAHVQDPQAPSAPPAPGTKPPMTVPEMREFMVRVLKRNVQLRTENVWKDMDPVDFAREWVADGGKGNPPAAFAKDGVILIQRGNYLDLVLFHEAVHQLADTNGKPELFRQKFGTFMEEGATERLTRKHLGGWSGKHAYDRHVQFQVWMEEKLGVTEDQITRAYLDGDVSQLEAAVRKGFDGDSVLTARFLDALAKVDYSVSDQQALAEAVKIMFTKQQP